MENPMLAATDSSSQPSDSAPISSSLPTKKLFIGNLPKTATKEEISTMFSQFGNILNIRLLTPYNKYDQKYAIIRFSAAEEALRAVKESAQFTYELKPIQVSLYKNKIRPEANICVKNLDPWVHAAALQELLSRFGEIVSCKIQSVNPSNYYAYVQFSSPKSASEAISKMNGAELYGQKLRVTKFKPKKKHEEDRISNTLYVRGFDESYTKEQLDEKFSKFGVIESSSVTSNAHAGDTKYIGFVRYEDKESAQKAIEALDGKAEGEITWFVKIFESKAIRRSNLALKINSKNSYWSHVNIAIYNLPPTFDENKLKELGSQFGKVDSVKISKSKKKQKAEEGKEEAEKGTEGKEEAEKGTEEGKEEPEKGAEEREGEEEEAEEGGAVTQETNNIVGFVCYSRTEEADLAREKIKDMEIEGNKIDVRKWKGKSSK